VLSEVYAKWRSILENRGHNEAHDFIRKHSLSLHNLVQIEDSRKQFLDALEGLGFLGSNSTKAERYLS
jgi:hypothetical protein